MKRIETLRHKMIEQKLDAVLVSKPENRYYLSGFTGSTGTVLITRDEQFFLTDFRYTSQVKQQCPGYQVIQISQADPIYQAINQKVTGTIGFEDDFMTVENYGLYSSKLEAEMVLMKRLLEDLRVIKDDEEIALMKQAQAIADLAFEHILGFIRPGVTEIEVANELIRFMKSHGASGESFEIIVASGVRGAMPHGVASEKVIQPGELVTLDFGCVYRGYCSDMTRTVAVGQVSDELQSIYNIVLQAQETALAAVKPGVTGQQLDTIARDMITEAGYGDYFGHGLGHGVGLEIHERPSINQAGSETLRPGMIITDEPGIYIDNLGGVRIEDIILVSEDGYEVLSSSPKELIVLPT